MAEQLHERTPMLSGYQLRLSIYEGPLDVLLRLIERSQLAIEDVSLVKVTDQFLEFIEKMIDAPPEVVADFTAVGARLTVLKSRSLLPRPVVSDDDTEPSDLTAQLQEYQRIKHLAKQLGDVHASGLHAYAPERRGAIALPHKTETTRLAPHEPIMLLRMLRRRLGMAPKPAKVIRQRRVVNLREIVGRISDLVDRIGTIRFSSAVSESRTRTDVATAFLAVLLLVRRQSIQASQAGLFGEIMLSTSDEIITPPHRNGTHDVLSSYPSTSPETGDQRKDHHD